MLGRKNPIALILSLCALSVATNLAVFWMVIEQKAGVGRFENAIHTRSLHGFPDNIPELVKLIRNTKKELFIAVDVASYGILSNYEGFRAYRDALKMKLSDPNVSVKMVAYTGNNLRDALSNSVGTTANLRLATSSGRFFERAEVTASLKEPAGITEGVHALNARRFRDRFLDVALQVDKRTMGILFNSKDESSDVRGLPMDSQRPVQLPLHFWVRDNEEAVFSIFSHSTEATSDGAARKPYEASVHTRDSAIIGALKGLHYYYFGKAIRAVGAERPEHK